MRVVVLTNQKGGVGKSTLSVLLAQWLAERHRLRVGVIDLDTQANASKSLARFGSGREAAEALRVARDPTDGGDGSFPHALRRHEAACGPRARQARSHPSRLPSAGRGTQWRLRRRRGRHATVARLAHERRADRGDARRMSHRARGIQHRRCHRHAQDDLRRAAALQPRAAPGRARWQPLQPALGAPRGLRCTTWWRTTASSWSRPRSPRVRPSPRRSLRECRCGAWPRVRRAMRRPRSRRCSIFSRSASTGPMCR